VAYGLGTGLAVVRKPGKLPARTYTARYDLEYGSDALEIHHDAVGDHHRCSSSTICSPRRDGLGCGRARPALRRPGGACAFVIELAFLNGRSVWQARTCSRSFATTVRERPADARA